MSTNLFIPTLALRNTTAHPGLVARVVDGLRRQWRIRSAAESLSGFSDAQLRDLGIARVDIERVVRLGR
jgi:uncharacterized protein YjiS (DUF1127 family)